MKFTRVGRTEKNMWSWLWLTNQSYRYSPSTDRYSLFHFSNNRKQCTSTIVLGKINKLKLLNRFYQIEYCSHTTSTFDKINMIISWQSFHVRSATERVEKTFDFDTAKTIKLFLKEKCVKNIFPSLLNIDNSNKLCAAIIETLPILFYFRSNKKSF